MTRTNILEKRQAFKAMHTDGCFLLPNPWDLGSARFLAGMGFKALASSSAGYAWTKGRPDGQLSREDVLNHLHELVEAVDVPINADFENGFAVDEDELEESIGLLLDTGVAGFSLEDSTGDPEEPLMPIEEAARRISIARALIDSTGHEVVLVGRAENFFVGVPDLDDTLERLKAYSEAGAD
ncbi:MAG TPA: isocitrate lyase/phosphoenolpyruvate mutase family protein, partial [Burkholderiaceae bacterium]|nr:isocitrate lyase/phosphoenolpyruvate mutase family protein [Burkholderiaceae bacterium]